MTFLCLCVYKLSIENVLLKIYCSCNFNNHTKMLWIIAIDKYMNSWEWKWNLTSHLLLSLLHELPLAILAIHVCCESIVLFWVLPIFILCITSSWHANLNKTIISSWIHLYFDKTKTHSHIFLQIFHLSFLIQNSSSGNEFNWSFCVSFVGMLFKCFY